MNKYLVENWSEESGEWSPTTNIYVQRGRMIEPHFTSNRWPAAKKHMSTALLSNSTKWCWRCSSFLGGCRWTNMSLGFPWCLGVFTRRGRSPVGLRAWHHCFDRCDHGESVLLLEQRHPVAMSSGGLWETSAGGPGLGTTPDQVQDRILRLSTPLRIQTWRRKFRIYRLYCAIW